MDVSELIRGAGLEKSDYCLMETVETERWAVYILNLWDVGNIANKPHHDLDAAELADRFLKLWEKGWIECTLVPFGSHVDLERAQLPVVAPNIRLLRFQLQHGPGWAVGDEVLVYGLAPVGAAVWEKLTVLDWSKCLRRGYDKWKKDCRIMSIVGSERDLVEEAFAVQMLEGAFEVPVPGTEIWSILEPWHVRYWKRLCVGHRVSFRFDLFENRCPACCDTKAHAEMFENLKRSERWRKSYEEVCAEYF